MNLRDLKYLIALAEHQHFGKAAEACFISQPALSMQIKKLEETLGVLLLERNNKRVLFTEVGKAIVKRAQHILQETTAIRDLAKAACNPYQGDLHLGVIPTIAPYLLPHIMSPLAEKFPQLSIYLCEQQTTHLLEKLSNGKLDAALLALPITDNDFINLALFEEKFLLAAPKHHPLSKRKLIEESDLEAHALFLLDEGHCLREQSLDLCKKMNGREVENFRASSLETLRHMVAIGLGITLIPQLAVQKNTAIHYITFKNPEPRRTIGLVYRNSSVKNKLLSEMGTQIKTILNSLQTGVMICE